MSAPAVADCIAPDCIEQIAPDNAGGTWVVRLKPYEDLVTSLMAFCAENNIRRLNVVGCVGSLMQATVVGADSQLMHVGGPGVEIVTLSGWLDRERPAQGALQLTVADRQGAVYTGNAAPGGNPVCVTAELVVQEWR